MVILYYLSLINIALNDVPSVTCLIASAKTWATEIISSLLNCFSFGISIVLQTITFSIGESINLLIEKRVAKTQKILADQNNQKKLNEGLRKLIEKRITMVQKELNLKKVSQ